MSALRIVLCGSEGCKGVFEWEPGQTIEEIRAALAAAGWTRRDYEWLCPADKDTKW